MSQLRPNQTELRSMDLYNQILCRFQKYKRKVPPPSLPPFEKKNVVFYGSKFFFPGIFFFRHPSKSCSVFYILEAKKFFQTDKKKNFKIIFFESSCTRDVVFSTKEGGRWMNFSLIFLEST